MLPMTPASLYLGLDKEYVKNNYEETLKYCDCEDSFKMQDILLMYLTLSKPDRALDLWNDQIEAEFGGSKPRHIIGCQYFVSMEHLITACLLILFSIQSSAKELTFLLNDN